MYLTTDPEGRELCLRPDLTIPVSCDYLASPQAGEPRRLLLSRPGVPQSRRGVRRSSCRPASSRSAGPTRRRPTPRCWRSGSRPPRTTASPAPEIRMGDVGAVRRADRGARSRAGLEAPPGEGFQPQDLAGARSRRAHARPPRARGRNTRACSPRWPAPIRRRAHALVTDLLSIAGITAVGGRSVGEIAERFLEQAALGAGNTLPRETRALIEKFLADRRRSRRGRRRAARARRRRQASRSAPRSTCSRAAPASSPRAASTSRASSFSTAFGRGFDYYTGFVFELHDPAARAERPAGRRRPLRRAADAARRQGADPGGRLRGLDRAARRHAEARHERAARHRGAVQGPAAGERRGVLRPRRARAGQAARRARLSRHHRRPARRRGRLSVGRRDRRRSSRRARCISASPARICCAR